ncbi:MAG: divergent PAP2 family protein [Candidatus Omnitrophica bacterium]|nr:divergent PAP2 family protein [Candidatus Omnitrophota bacterium]
MTPLDQPFEPVLAAWAVFLSWALSQLAKVIRGMIRERRFNFRWIFDTGGMPSSHSASVASLATSMGLYYGFLSMPFLMTLVFTIITMFDAAGVRRSAGRQAQVLNKMLDELYQKGQFAEERVKELLGHTPVEVFAGAFLGILISFLFCGMR